jgi:outer membrane protein assembly factor BamB
MRRILLATVLLATPAFAENWARWRGPHQNGTTSLTGLPVTWGPQQNVKWKIDAGRGASCPSVWNDRIYLTTGRDGKNLLQALDWDGKTLWTAEIGKEIPGKHRKASGSNPTPAVDDQHIYVYYKSGDLAAVTHAGAVAWRRNLQSEFAADNLWWDLGTSPVLTRDSVVIAVMQTGNSYLAAFDRRTGAVRWKVDRNLDSVEEAHQAYSTPLVLEEKGRETLVTLGADHVTSHDAATGELLWIAGGFNPNREKFWRSIAGPVLGAEGLVAAPYARGGTLTGVKLGGSGDVTATHKVWETRDAAPVDVPTPAAHQGKIYVCSDKGKLTCVDALTGKTEWQVETEKARAGFSASPVLAEGRAYLTREDGVVFVVDLAKREVVARNAMDDEFTVATPVPAPGKWLLRSEKTLVCVGQ